MKVIFNLFKESFTRYYVKECQNKPLTHAALEYIFTDMAGKKYYRFPDAYALPFERFGKRQDYTTWLTSALSPDEIDKLIDAADKLLTEGLTAKKNAARIGAILWQMKERKNKCLHSELLYNILAVQYVREDEQPNIFNNQIQNEKVIAFKELNQTNASFFFQIPELKQLLRMLNLSEAELTDLLAESEKQIEFLNQSLKIYSSDTSSSPATSPLTAS